MAKFVAWRDFFKWNKTLMEDEFNSGKAYTVKHKKKLSSGCDLETNAKVDEAKEGSHKLSVDHKVKGSITEFGGVDWEVKAYHDGKVEYKEGIKYL